MICLFEGLFGGSSGTEPILTQQNGAISRRCVLPSPILDVALHTAANPPLLGETRMLEALSIAPVLHGYHSAMGSLLKGRGMTRFFKPQNELLGDTPILPHHQVAELIVAVEPVKQLCLGKPRFI